MLQSLSLCFLDNNIGECTEGYDPNHHADAGWKEGQAGLAFIEIVVVLIDKREGGDEKV
jgi:hypothetical protein